MKLLIAADMEGITGVVNWSHVTPGSAEYTRFRGMMTADVNAAIRGALAGGASPVLVVDGHGDKTNLLIEALDPRASLHTGSGPLGMVQGIETGVDAVFFIGYHARAGTPSAVLAHTVSGARIANVWLNGRVVGEIGINAAVCAHYGAPVLLVSGCAAACAEAAHTLPGVLTVETKTASGFSAAGVLPPEITHARIEAAAQQAVTQLLAGPKPTAASLPAPVQFTVEFHNPSMAERAARLPGVEQINPRQVQFSAPDASLAYRLFRLTVQLASN